MKAHISETAYLQEASISGNCFRVNPEGRLRGKGGDYGKMRLIFFADLNDYRFNDHPASFMHSMHKQNNHYEANRLNKAFAN